MAPIRFDDSGGLMGMSPHEKERIALGIVCPICGATKAQPCRTRVEVEGRKLAHRARVVQAARERDRGPR